jgi:sarcosine oxidase, subunit beta
VDILLEHGKVQAVKTKQTTIYTSIVINATGVHSPFIAQLVGLSDIAVRPLRRQLLMTEPCHVLPENAPMIVELSSGFHFRRRDGGVVFALPLPPGAEEEQLNQAMAPEAFQLDITNSLWPQVQELTRHRCLPLAEAQLAHEWAGLYEMTPDEQPILGKTKIDGFLCASGFSGHGFMHAPLAARLLTELLLDGQCRTLDIEQFSHERFRTGALLKTTRLL